MADDPVAAIAALRAQGAQQREPLRFHFITALARRSTAQAGALRQRLDARLAQALAELQQRLAASEPAPAAAAGPAAPGPLAALLRQAGSAGPATPATSAAPELKAVQQFGNTWARLRVDQQLQTAQARQPDNAGPLNSQRLMLQTLQQLRGLSPAYLQRFMAHADALLWLEQGSAGRDDGERKRKSGRSAR